MDHAADAFRTDLMTITRFVLNEQSKYPESRGDFSILLSHIVLGCKFVCSAVNKAGLAKLIGLAGETNVQGEEQKKLDVLSNEVFVKALVSSGRTCILVSEEDEEATFVEHSQRGKYCVVFDPLDGSSNIDCGVSIGTIFGIYLVKDGGEATLGDVLKPGKNMVAAGYCMYGSSCTISTQPFFLQHAGVLSPWTVRTLLSGRFPLFCSLSCGLFFSAAGFLHGDVTSLLGRTDILQVSSLFPATQNRNGGCSISAAKNRLYNLWRTEPMANRLFNF